MDLISRGRTIKNAILIAGPTASGKSGLAMRVAAQVGGVIVNADSMQVYSTLRLLTARPGPADLERVAHELYGHVPPETAYSTGAWLADVAALAEGGRFESASPVFVGGTGLYFRVLLEGLSDMPDIPDAVRENWRARLADEGAATLHKVLAERDPGMAERLNSGDGQRIVRALEVLEASGRSIVDWQSGQGVPLVDRESARCFVLDPDRTELVQRIETRFDRMIEDGAMDEVRRLVALDLDPKLPAMKAIGVRELAAADRGVISLDDAIVRAKAATRQYAKRQTTWFRHQFSSQWARLRSPDQFSL